MEFLLILGGCALVVGVAYIVMTVLSRRKRESLWDWPAVQGEVVDTALYRHERRTLDKHEITYTPVVAYRYTVEEQAYRSQQRDFAPYSAHTFTDHVAATAVLTQYPLGSAVTVRYNPRAPQQAVLKIKRPVGYHTELIFGISNLAAGVVSILLFFLLR